MLALSIFPLLWVGGMVTSKGAGMSVPDWPTSFGYNMFLLPWDKWSPFAGSDSGGIFWEHFHRLLGMLAGFVAIALVAAAFITDRRKWVRIGASLLLLAIIIQGIKGGLRVRDVSLTLAIAHGIFGQAVFSGACLFVLATSAFWTRTAGEARLRTSKWISKALVIVTLLCLTQLTVGAIMRHNPLRGINGGAGLAIPDWPLHYGKVLPPISAAGVQAVNQVRPFTYNLPTVTAGEIHLHFLHRMGAYTLALIALVTVSLIVLRHRDNRALLFGGVTLGLLVTLQITWGVLTVLYKKPADIATLHQATGALLLMTCVLLTFITLGWSNRRTITGFGVKFEEKPQQYSAKSQSRPLLNNPTQAPQPVEAGSR